MYSRRDFVKTTLAAAAILSVSGPIKSFASPAGYPSGIFYTKDNPGKWAGKEKSHAPQVSVKGNKVTVRTKHSMSNEHYIVRHTLVSADGKVIGAQTFFPTDPRATSTFTLPDGASGRMYATSFCNKHDLWISEFSL